jgi:hypothetical protein
MSYNLSANQPSQFASPGPAVIDIGLRQYMLRVYGQRSE